MKKILTLLFSFFTIMIGFTQAPNLINYQGVARNSVGNVLPNQAIAVKLSIRDLTATGAVVYSEIRNVTTNFYGLFSFGIGSPGATGVTGTIAGVNWAVGAKFLQVEIDPTGGSSFTNVGTTQLLSVPYALFSNAANPAGPAGGDLSGTYPNPTVARIRGVNVSTTAPTIGQVLGFDGTNWVPATNLAAALTLPYRDSASSATQPVVELIQLNLTTVQPGLSGITRSTAGNAVGVLGTVSSTSPGGFSAAVRGNNNGTSGLGIGVYGQQAGSGWGVYGTTPSGIGVHGFSTNGFGIYGLSTNGIGVYGLSTNAGAGFFEILNSASTANALSATTNGTGFAANFTSSNATPNALRTVGGIQLTGIGEALNRVLTSDASGNATWQAIGGGGVGAITGSGTLNYVPKWTPDGTTLGNSLIFDNGTNVGIGTITPSYILDVAGVSRITDAVGQDQALIIKSTGANGNRISFTDPSDTRLATVGLNPTNSQLLINNAQDPGASTTLYPVVLQAGGGRVNLQSNNGLLFIGNNVDRFIIKPDGNVGIGTITPIAKFQVTDFNITNNALQTPNLFLGATGIGVIDQNAQAANEKWGIFSYVNGNSNQQIAVFGDAGYTGTLNTGIYGNVWDDPTPGIARAIRGVDNIQNANTYAGLFTGRVHVIGDLTATGVKPFTIDHPLDPENKLLRHFSMESPEVLNVYSGNTITDANGKATVMLPDYFESINKDFRYQLTVIGTFAQAIISKEVSNNQFEVATNQPNVKVSWEVKALRNDLYMKNANKMKAVEEKPTNMKGKYMNAKAYGLPASKGMDYEGNRQTVGQQQSKPLPKVIKN